VRPKITLPRLCPPTAHDFRFVDRVQLSLPEATLGGYALAVYLQCVRCVAGVEFLGVCDGVRTQVNSAWLLLPDGRGWELSVAPGGGVLVASGPEEEAS
jgi:hypothetical protein